MSQQPIKLRFFAAWRRLDVFDKTALALAGAFFAFWTFILSLKYFNLKYYDWDLALYAQAMWDLCHGRLYSSLFDMNFLANHAEYISFLLIPLYAVFQHPLTLIFLKVGSYAAAGFVLYLIAKPVLPPLLSLIFAFLYLAFPANLYALLYEFHIESLNMVFLFLLYYFFSRERLVPFYITAFLIALIKENMPLVVIAYGIYALFAKKDKLRWGVAPILFGAGVFSLAMFVITPALRTQQGFSDPNVYLFLYKNLGDTPIEMAKTAVFHPEKILGILAEPTRLKYLSEFIRPLGLMPLLSPHILWLGAPILLQHLLSSAFQTQTVFYHYAATLAPFFFLAALETLKRARRMRPPIFYVTFITIMLCAIINIGIYRGSIQRRIARIENPNKDVQWDMLRQIPPEGSTIATLSFLSAMAHKEELYSFLTVANGHHALSARTPLPPAKISNALIDLSDPWIIDKIAYEQDLESILRMQTFLSQGWKIRDIAGDLLLLDKSANADFRLIERSEQPFLPQDPADTVLIADRLRFLKYTSENIPSPGRQNVLRLDFYWKAESKLSTVFGMHLRLNRNGQAVLDNDRIIGYALIPTIVWHSGEYVKETYYLYTRDLAPGPYELQVHFVEFIDQAPYRVNCPSLQAPYACREGNIDLGWITVPRQRRDAITKDTE